MRARILGGVLIVAAGLIFTAGGVQAKKHRKSHKVDVTVNITNGTIGGSPPTIVVTSSGTVSGRPFGSGTATSTQTSTGATSHVEFSFTFPKGTIHGAYDCTPSTCMTAPNLVTGGTGKFKGAKGSLTPSNVVITGPMSDTFRLTGKVKY